jgi:hypothetical protein
MNNQESELSLATITKLLGAEQKAKFFDAFWATWSVNGFGTLTKKDTELLIFGCLKQVFGEKAPVNNYHWAKLLRVTPSKIKSLRLEAHLRFGHLFGESTVGEGADFLAHFTNLQSIDVTAMKATEDIHDVWVSFVIEDPVVQMEVEGRLKDVGSYLDFHRNREVVKMRLTSFLSLLADEQQQEAIDKWVAAKAEEKAKEDGLIKRVSAATYANKTEAGKLMAFIDDLAKFGKVEILTNHLKMIFASQMERKK